MIHQEHWDDENGRTKRFFRNFRNPFRGRSRKGRGQDDRFMDWERMPESNPSLQVPKLRKSFSEDVGSPYQNHRTSCFIYCTLIICIIAIVNCNFVNSSQ